LPSSCPSHLRLTSPVCIQAPVQGLIPKTQFSNNGNYQAIIWLIIRKELLKHFYPRRPNSFCSGIIIFATNFLQNLHNSSFSMSNKSLRLFYWLTHVKRVDMIALAYSLFRKFTAVCLVCSFWHQRMLRRYIINRGWYLHMKTIIHGWYLHA
jgi:hypothetical protein